MKNKKRPTASPQPEARAPARQDLPWQWFWPALAFVLVVTAAIRVYAALDAFWFDEVWSLYHFGQAAQTPWEVFTFRHDNNHHLVSLWMHACGLRGQWFVYRVPSIAGGVATVALAAWWALRFSRFAALAAAILTGGSFVLVTYASEARGYALAGGFALAGLVALDRYLAEGKWWQLVAFAASVLLGLLSHSTFLFFYLGALAWSAVALWQKHGRFGLVAIEMLKIHAVPLVLLVAFYLLHVRGMIVGGGPVYSAWTVIGETLALVAGGSGNAALDVVLALAVSAGAILALVWLIRQRDPLWALFAVTLVAAPAAVLIVARPPLLYVRYFYVPLLFGLLLLSYLLEGLRSRVPSGGWLAAAILVAITLGNAWPTVQSLRDGRGQYLAALNYLAQRSNNVVVFQSDHDFETRYLLEFYRHHLPPDVKLVYLDQTDASGNVPQWTIVNSQQQPLEPAPAITDAKGRRYQLDRTFPCSGLSGYHWIVYRLGSG